MAPRPQIDIPDLNEEEGNDEQQITATRTGNSDDEDNDNEETRPTDPESTSSSTRTSTSSESDSSTSATSTSSSSDSDSSSSTSSSDSESESPSETESLITSSSTSSSDASSSFVTETQSTVEPTLTDSLIQQDSSDLASATSSASAKSDADSESDSTGLGTIVGIVAVGAIALIVLSSFVLWKRKQRAHRKLKTEQSAAAFGGRSSSDDDLTEVKAIPRGLEEEHWSVPPVPPRSAAPFLARPESPYASAGYGAGAGGMGYAGSAYTLGEVRSPSPLVMPPPRDFASPAPSYHPSYTPSMDLYGGMYAQPQQQQPPPTVEPLFNAPSPSPTPYTQWDHGQQFQEPEQPSMAYMPTSNNAGNRGECLSPQTAEAGQAPMTRASKCTSGFSCTSADNRISTSAFPVPPPSSKDEEEVPALPPLTEIDSRTGAARGSVSDPIPRSLTPGHNTLDRHSQAFRQSFMARPVSHLSSTASFETATENDKDRFFLPPLQIPTHQSAGGETEESESLEQTTTMEPPRRPFVASPLEMEGSLQEALPRPGSNRSSASTIKRGADDSADLPNSGSPFATKPKEGSTLAHVAQASISSTSSATHPSPFDSSEDDLHQPGQRDSFDILGHYGSSNAADAGASEVLGGNTTQPIHRQGQQTTQQGEAGQGGLNAPGRVTNSDWGFLDDLLDGDRDQNKAAGGRPL